MTATFINAETDLVPNGRYEWAGDHVIEGNIPEGVTIEMEGGDLTVHTPGHMGDSCKITVSEGNYFGRNMGRYCSLDADTIRVGNVGFESQLNSYVKDVVIDGDIADMVTIHAERNFMLTGTAATTVKLEYGGKNLSKDRITGTESESTKPAAKSTYSEGVSGRAMLLDPEDLKPGVHYKGHLSVDGDLPDNTELHVEGNLHINGNVGENCHISTYGTCETGHIGKGSYVRAGYLNTKNIGPEARLISLDHDIKVNGNVGPFATLISARRVLVSGEVSTSADIQCEDEYRVRNQLQPSRPRTSKEAKEALADVVTDLGMDIHYHHGEGLYTIPHALTEGEHARELFTMLAKLRDAKIPIVETNGEFRLSTEKSYVARKTISDEVNLFVAMASPAQAVVR